MYVLEYPCNSKCERITEISQDSSYIFNGNPANKKYSLLWRNKNHTSKLWLPQWVSKRRPVGEEAK